jgi:hypothetical protein
MGDVQKRRRVVEAIDWRAIPSGFEVPVGSAAADARGSELVDMGVHVLDARVRQHDRRRL